MQEKCKVKAEGILIGRFNLNINVRLHTLMLLNTSRKSSNTTWRKQIPTEDPTEDTGLVNNKLVIKLCNCASVDYTLLIEKSGTNSTSRTTGLAGLGV